MSLSLSIKHLNAIVPTLKKGLGDSHHILALGRLPEELNHHIKALLWVINEDILDLDGRETITGVVPDPFREPGAISGEKQIRPVVDDQFADIGQTDHAAEAKYVMLGNIQLDHIFRVQT